MSETEKKALDERLKALDEKEKKLNSDKLEFLQNRLVLIGKDDPEVIRSITNEVYLTKLIEKRTNELAEETKKKAEEKKNQVPIANAGSVSGAIPNMQPTLNKKDEIQKLVANFSPPEFFLPDQMLLRENGADAQMAYIPGDRDHPYPRMVG